MMSREEYLKNITSMLATLKVKIELSNSINLYDINIVAETFFAGLVNIIEDWTLKNVNAVMKNAPGIDLVDDVNKVAIQVTSDNTSDKIKHTLDEFISNSLYKKYERLIVLILKGKKQYTTRFNSRDLFVFDASRDIWDVEDLINKVNGLNTDKLKELNDYLDNELNVQRNNRPTTEATEVETIMNLIEFISSHKNIVDPQRNVIIDPEYKINQRFKHFAQLLINQYTLLLSVYGTALNNVKQLQGGDDAQDIITMLYLQDKSLRYLDESNNDPIKALNLMVNFFQTKLSERGKQHDEMAIKFYLIYEMINCSVFPNEAR